MILRRFMQHFKEQNWFAVGLDVVVVIVGIFLGLQVAEWNESNKLLDTEKEYLRLIDDDLDEIIKHASSQMDFERSRLRYSAELITILDSEQQTIKTERVGRLLTLLSIRRTPNFNRSAFEDIKSSGKLSVIRDANLRRKIIDFFNRIERWERIVDKNNGVFIDVGFTQWLINIGVNHRPPLSQSTEQYQEVWEDETYFNLFREEKISNEMRTPEDLFLAAPQESEIWGQIRQKITWRTDMAAINYRGANRMIEIVNDLKSDIRIKLTE